ncbi:hypothetical protein T440DRAFT_91469 [Plenodomus tracheiphilus IPT5]|uniref:C2H2-type domain-containing protein n=1 Tax=Plenodomus tracheiphilus IPT5 TaxID=1408161 RepID=A0A6A7B8D9_9PLEO|nr:hypothetical protein T440DRAFT_91469 [Plenodomus tracheiphilus IPT5]
MADQQSNSWQMPAWNEEPLDPLWTPDYSTIDFSLDFPGVEPSFLGVEQFDPDPNSNHGNPESSYAFDNNFSPAIDTLPSPDFTSEQIPHQTITPEERPTQLRQHTLPRRRSKYVLRRNNSKSSPMMIPSPGISPRPFEAQPLAMQRWQNSPPEDEAASLSAIFNALDGRPLGISPQNSRPSSRDAFRKYRGPSSTTSLESAASESSLRSWNSSHSAAAHSNRGRRTQTPKSRGKAKSKGRNMNAVDRIFKCTFCCDTFKHKYDWARHEKSLHLNMEEWICTPNGGSVLSSLTGRVHCAYCNALDPTLEHLQEHNHSACLEERSTPRVFRRKDHLVQHLRLFHGLETLPLIDDWKVESMPVKSRCGFCDASLETWDERADHLAAHYREGKTMEDWRGDHAFEPAVAARVTKAFPPWLIASQSTTLVPFSATNPAALDHTNQLLARIELEATQDRGTATPGLDAFEPPPDVNIQPMPTQQEVDTATFADILSSHLSRFARQQMLLGIVPTDEMFQRESRRLLYYDGDDKWNQTVADDPTWLQEFKQRSGFDGTT